MNVWKFGEAQDSLENYSDGTVVPHRRQVLFLNDVAVGEIEIHCHKRAGDDKVTDLSYGVTAITYGPLATGGK